MPSWPAKDPDAVFDYSYTIALDDGDTVVGDPLFTKLSGTVVIDNEIFDPAIVATDEVARGQKLTVWLSGGANGETSVFRVSWTTAGGREDDDIITLPVVAHELDALVLTGYAKPLPGHLIARYPAFAAVPVSTIRTWLSDAERFVDTSWAEGDYAAALMSLAAHNMALAGIGTGNASLAGVPVGITRMKSGSLELGFTDAAANARMSGTFAATRYGQEYQTLLRRNRGGPLVSSTGVVRHDPYLRYPLGLG